MGRPKNVAGQRFGILTAVELVGKIRTTKVFGDVFATAVKGPLLKPLIFFKDTRKAVDV